MKMIIVTSTITYIPNNYNNIIIDISKKNKENISAVILVKIDRFDVLKKVILLFLAGAFNLAGILFLNLIRDLLKIKEKKLKKNGIKVLKVKNVNSDTVLSFIKKNKISLVFNLRSRAIFKKEILNIDGLKILNLHHGILPSQRGVFSDLRNLAFDGELGFSIHEVNEKIDDGKILAIKKIEYIKNKNYLDYLKYSENIEKNFLEQFLKDIFFKNKIPKGFSNYCNSCILYKNPTWKEIKEMKKNGLKI